MILVTGSTGFVGRSLMRVLAQGTRTVKAYTGRMNDPFQLKAELEDVDTAIHLAGAEARGHARLLNQVDVDGTERLLRECQRQGVSRILLLSRLGADPNSLYSLLRAKGQQERLVKHSGIAYTILRSATLFGRDDRFLNTIAGLAAWTWPLVWVPGGGHAAMQPLWVEDLVRCLDASLDRTDLLGETLEVAGEERMRYADIVHQVLAATGLHRIPFAPNIRLTRFLSSLLFGWWHYPPVTRFFIDRLSVPEVAPLDSVLRQFDFHPERMVRQTAYLRRPGLRRRTFRR